MRSCTRSPGSSDPLRPIHSEHCTLTAAVVAAAEPLPLTERQAEVLSVVTAYHEAVKEGCPASIVARRLCIYHEAVRGHFAALYRKGWLIAETSPAVPRRPFLSRRD